MYLKIWFCGVIGAMGGFISSFLGGWDAALSTLVWCIVLDYLTGIIVAGVFKKSEKSENGTLSSSVGLKGLCRKIMIIFFVALAYRMDIILQSDYIRYTVIIGFICNEVISLIENAGLMGVPIPSVIKKAIDILKSKESEENKI